MTVPAVISTSDASGAAQAAGLGYVVVIVDLIDMSTTAETLLDAGALAVYGAAPDNAVPPVPVDPGRIGEKAGEKAGQMNTGVVIAAEPRAGTGEERRDNTRKVRKGLEKAGGSALSVVPNLGAETARLVDIAGKVAVLATGTGGVAFDAAYNAGAPAVITGTVARTPFKKGKQPAEDSANKAVELARRFNTGVAVVAASKNSLEDILAAQYISTLVMHRWS